MICVLEIESRIRNLATLKLHRLGGKAFSRSLFLPVVSPPSRCPDHPCSRCCRFHRDRRSWFVILSPSHPLPFSLSVQERPLLPPHPFLHNNNDFCNANNRRKDDETIHPPCVAAKEKTSSPRVATENDGGGHSHWGVGRVHLLANVSESIRLFRRHHGQDRCSCYCQHDKNGRTPISSSSSTRYDSNYYSTRTIGSDRSQ